MVITVPAYFGVAEREATRRAGELAELNVLDVLAEPVAAALHYRAVTGPAEPAKHALVYDLGGGTFDTTVDPAGGRRRHGGLHRRRRPTRRRRLGPGDRRLPARPVRAEHPRLHPEHDPQFMQDLLIAAERLKEELSAAQSRRYVMRFGGAVT